MSEKSEEIHKVYQFGDLSHFSFKERLIIRIADLAFFGLIKLIGKTIRFEVEGWEHFEQIEGDGKIPIYNFWHNRLFLHAYFWRNRGIVVMTSQSFDGEYIARAAQRFGYGSSRGSSTRGGMKSLVELIRLMKKGSSTAFTIDGPKGPKYIAKLGSCLLAKKTGNPLLPLSIESQKFWQIKSWDNLQIPKPFSRAKVLLNPPIYISNETNDEELENKRLELQSSLDELVNRGVQWRESEK